MTTPTSDRGAPVVTPTASGPSSGDRAGAGESSPGFDSHKEALAIGREQGRTIRRYLEALEANKPRRGRRRTPEGIQRRLAAIDERLATADPLDRLHLRQERMDLEAELATAGEGGVDLGALEAEFVHAAGPYSQRKGITYDAWRAAGVEPRVLKAAGLGRGQ